MTSPVLSKASAMAMPLAKRSLDELEYDFEVNFSALYELERKTA